MLVDRRLFILFILFYGPMTTQLMGQSLGLTGRVLDQLNGAPISNALVALVGENQNKTVTDQDGYFMISLTPNTAKTHVLIVQHEQYEAQNVPIKTDAQRRPIVIFLQWNTDEDMPISDTSYADLTDEGSFDLPFQPGPLQAKGDALTGAQAYDFGGVFYAPRGAARNQKQISIQGVPINDFYSGQASWDSFGGLNDALRQREIQEGFESANYSFGALGGHTDISVSAGNYRPGLKLKAIFSSKTYTRGYALFYRSGLKANGLSYALQWASRFGDGGYVSGNIYDGKSLLFALEKQINGANTLMLTGLYTPIIKGVSSPLTREVLDYHGARYNPNWGMQNGQIRNSKSRQTTQPLFILTYKNHSKGRLSYQINLATQFGLAKQTRLNYSGSSNPFKNYYQKLPSYFLKESPLGSYDYHMAFNARQNIEAQGQLNWQDLYMANGLHLNSGSSYIVQADVRQKQMTVAQALMRYRLNTLFEFRAKVWIRQEREHHYGQIDDLLGGLYYLDVNSFYRGSDPLGKWNDRQTPYRSNKVGAFIDYNFRWQGDQLGLFGQLQQTTEKWNYTAAFECTRNALIRKGLFQNGSFPSQGQSLGPSQRIVFSNIKFKLSGAINWSPRSFSRINTVYLTEPPIVKHTFVNMRQSNELVHGLKASTFHGVDVDYRYQGNSINARIAAYAQRQDDDTKIKTFFTEHAIAAQSGQALVHEIVQGIHTQSIGLQAGLSYDLSNRLALSTVMVFSEHNYSGTPLLYLGSDAFSDPQRPDRVLGSDLTARGKRKVYVNNYGVASGPRQIIHARLQYRDPNYWWAGLSFNHFSKRFADMSFLRRSADTYLDFDGVLNQNFDSNVVSSLLEQEDLGQVVLCHLTAGKSWRLKGKYISLFLVVNNLLDVAYVSGGFEDSRIGSVFGLAEEADRPGGPLFGNRYFSGMGRSFYGSITLSF